MLWRPCQRWLLCGDTCLDMQTGGAVEFDTGKYSGDASEYKTIVGWLPQVRPLGVGPHHTIQLRPSTASEH